MKKYSQKILSLFFGFAVLWLSACATGPSAEEATAAGVGAVDVEAGAADVAVDRVFTVTFTVPVDAATVTADTFFIVPGTRHVSRAFDATVCVVANAIDATVACASATECSLTPTANLDDDSTYVLCLTPDVAFADPATYGSFGGLSVSFTTAAATPEPVTSTSITPDDQNIVLRTLTQYRLYDADGVEHTEDAEWSSDDTDVFAVSNTAGTKGLVTAVTVGSARIRAAYSGEIASTLVTVIGGLDVVSGIAVSDISGATTGSSNTSRNITVDQSLGIHVAWGCSDARSEPGQVRYSRSIDLGNTFEASVRVDSGSESIISTVTPVIASSGRDYIYIAYQDTAGSIYLVRSTDAGDTWSTPAKVADSLGSSKLSIATFNEHLYILTNTSPMKMVVSNDYGATSSVVTTALSAMAYEDVLADPSNGDVYILQDSPTLYWSVSHDDGITFSDRVTVTGLSVLYSDYTISQLGSIFIAGSGGPSNNAAYFDLSDLSFTQVNYPATATATHTSVAVDGLNIIHIVASVSGDVYLYDSDDNGASYTNQLIVSGATYPDIAPTTFVDGAPILYVKDNAVFYSFVRDE